MAKQEGFTLLELLIVLIIIGVLVTLAIPQYQKIVEKARVAEAIQIMGILRKAQEAHYAATSRYQQVNATNDPDDPLWKKLGIDNPNAQLGTYFNYDFLYRPDFQQMYDVNGYAWLARPRNEFAVDPYPPACRYITMKQDTGEIAGTYPH